MKLQDKVNEKVGEVLDTAKTLVTGDRAKDHGEASSQHATIAAFWSMYLQGKGKLIGDIEPYEVAVLMQLMKISRDAHGSFNKDTFIDIAGYSGLAYAIKEIERSNKTIAATPGTANIERAQIAALRQHEAMKSTISLVKPNDPELV